MGVLIRGINDCSRENGKCVCTYYNRLCDVIGYSSLSPSGSLSLVVGLYQIDRPVLDILDLSRKSAKA